MKKLLIAIVTIGSLVGVAPAATPIQDALDCTSLQFTTGGDAAWFAQTTDYTKGRSAMRSGAIGDDGQTWLKTTVNGSKMLTFKWKVSSEDVAWDFVEVTVDGEPQGAIGGTDRAWIEKTVALRGDWEHEVVWTYRKDSSTSEGSDCAWLDAVSVTDIPASVTVSFDANGGTLALTARTFATDGTYGTLPEPEREGWNFDGWFTAVRGGERVYEDEDVRLDVKKLFAHWSIPLEEALGIVDDIQVWAEEPIVWTGTDEDSHDGYGAAVGVLTGDVYSYGDLMVEVPGPGTLTFWWRTFGRGHGSVYDENYRFLVEVWYPSVWDSTGHEVIQDGVWQQVTVCAYGEGSHTFRIDVGRSGMPADEVAGLFVDEMRFTPAPANVTVRFDANGGTVGTESMEFETDGTYGSLPMPESPDGLDFDGWFTALNGGRRVEEGMPVRFDAPVLYAHWSIPLEEALGIDGSDDFEDVYASSSSGSDVPAWSGTLDDSHDGYGVARTQGQGGELYMTVRGSGTISFWWRVVGNASAGFFCNYGVSRADIYQTLTWDPITGETIYLDGDWQHVTVDVIADEDDSTALMWGGGSPDGSGAVLVDEVEWMPAPDSITVEFVTAKGSVWKTVTCVPGETLDDAGGIPEPQRTGFVFGGWFTDPKLTKEADVTSPVPFSGATLYAKWYRTLAAASTADLIFKNNPNSAKVMQWGLIETSDWELVERTYTDGESVLAANLGGRRREVMGGPCGEEEYYWTTYYTVAVLETTITGSGFLDFVWGMAYGDGYGSLILTVDGDEVASLAQDYSALTPGTTVSESRSVVLGSGTHTVRWEAYGMGTVTMLESVAKRASAQAKTIGEWLGRVKDYHYWTKSNLSSLKADYAAAQNTGPAGERYKAAIEHALTTLLALGEDPLVASTFKQFGFTLDLEMLSVEGKFSYASAPQFNRLVDDAVAKAQPAIEAALTDLESIPSGWDGVVTLAAGDYPVDEDVAIDYGDVLYLRSALKGALGAAYWVKAYNTEFDWKKLDADCQGVKIPTASSAPILASDANWSAPADFSKALLESADGDEEGAVGSSGQFRTAWYRNKLCFKVPKSEFILPGMPSLRVVLDDGLLSSHSQARLEALYFEEGLELTDPVTWEPTGERIYWFVSGEGVDTMPTVDFQENDEAFLISIDLTGTEIAKDTTLRYVKELAIETSEFTDSSFAFGTLRYDAMESKKVSAVLDQTKMFDKVRAQEYLSKSRTCVASALDLAQKADKHILEQRTYGGNCLVNYADRDAGRLQAMRDHVATAIASLDSAQEFDWTEGLSEKWLDRFSYVDNPVSVYLGALFGGRVTRSLIPGSLRPDVYAPCIDEMPDATMGGLLPDMTIDKWVEYAEAEGLEYRNEEFGLVVPDSPYELTPGEAASIELAVAGCGADAKVTVQSSSLPTGMKYDAAKRIISGKPTKPGDYSIAVTVTSGTRTSTKYLAVYVAPFPALRLVIADEDAERAGCTVSGGGNYMSGTKVTLKATVAKGWVFTGWDGLPDSYVGDCRNPSAAIVTDAEDREIYASFCRIPDDWLDIEDQGTVEYALNEPVADDMTIFDAVHSGSLPTITVKDLPTGLKFDAKTGAISGKPTKEEFKFVTVSAKNAGGYTFTRVLRMSVGGAEEPRKEEAHAYLNLSWLENINVGYAVDQRVSDGSAATVSGLPTGLKYDSKTGKVTGTPTKPGVYTVKATMKDPDNKSKTLTSEFRSIVQDGGSRYIEVLSGDDGTATGSGVYAAGATFKPTAKAANNFVFAGWVTYDPEAYDGEYPVQQDYGADWRNPSQQWIVNDNLPTLLVATFVSKNAGACDRGDTYCEILPSDGDEWTADVSEGDSYFNFAVGSASLPKITVKGLPSGITFGGEKDCVAADDEDSVVWYRLKADSTKPPKPGVYEVEISAENQSKTKAEPVTVTVTVPNWTSDYIHVNDRYGDFIPGEEMDAVSLDDALDSWDGATFKVEGLPQGMTWNAKANVQKGIEAHTITGKPTKPGNYTVTFTLKIGSGANAISAQATSTFVVLPYPELEVVLEDAESKEAGCKVTGGGNYPSGSKVTLKATAAKGWVFAGWYGLPDSYVGDWRNPSAAIVTGPEDAAISAFFLRVKDDWLGIEDPGMVEYALNEPVADDMTIFDAVHSGSLPTITVKDLPTGLKFDAKTGAISGKPTKKEFKFVTVSAKNAGGYTFTRVLRMSVGGAEEPRKEEAHAYLNLSWLENINVGYAVDQRVSDGSAATVSGLPTGLKYDSKTGKVTGTPTKPGVYTVKATMKDPYDSRVTLTSEFRSIVQDGGSRYIEVLSEDDGTASGSGVYAAGATFKPTAKAANNFVFSGWVTYDPEDYDGEYPVQQDYGADWRNPSQQWIVNDKLPTLLMATFVAKNAGACDRGDTYCEIVPFEGNEWYADTAEGDVYFNFVVGSASLPKITVKGLPSGITFGGEKDCVASSYGDSVVWYRLKADSTKPPKPGVYEVEISAENQSKTKAEPVMVRITVPNWRSDVFSGLEYDAPYLRMVGMNSLYDESEFDFFVEEGWTVTQSGLPAGMKFAFNKDEALGHISGTPSKAGNYTLILTAKKGSQTEQASVTFVVEAFPEELAGTFNGFVTWEDWCDPLASVGTFTLTSGKDGKISAKASYDGTSVILTATGWSLGSDGTAKVSLEKSTTKSGCKFFETMDLSVDLTQPWDQWQVTGPWWHDYSDCAYSPSSAELYVSAQRSPYGKVGTKYENPEAHDIAATLAKFGQMTVDLEETSDGWYEKACSDCGLGGSTSQLKFTVKDTGVASVAGKLGTVSVSGSTTLTIIEEDCFAGYCIKVGSKNVRIKVSFDGSGISQCDASIEDTAKN